MKKIIGLMGNSGSGKSTVAKYLSDKGATVIDADQISHRLCDPGQLGLKEVKKAFDPYFFNDDGTLNRRRMGRHVFSNQQELRKLEEILHPLILQEVNEKLVKIQDGLVVLDAALLVEVGLVHLVDETWLVKADLDTKINRICERDQITHNQAIERLRNQENDDNMVQFADHVIANDGTRQQLIHQVEELLTDEQAK